MDINNTQNIQGNTGILNAGDTAAINAGNVNQPTALAAADFDRAVGNAAVADATAQAGVPGAGDRIAPVNQGQQQPAAQSSDPAVQIGMEGAQLVSEMYSGIFKKIQKNMPKDTIKKAIERQKEQENREVV